MTDGDLFTEEATAQFEQFWAAYPRKTNKYLARRAFQKLGPDLKLFGIMLAAVAYDCTTRSWQERDASGILRYVPHAATWLHQRRWEDDRPERPADTSAKAAAERTRTVNTAHVLTAPLPFILGQSS